MPLEVDQAIHPLVPAAAEPGGHNALIVPAALLAVGNHQRLFRLLFAVGDLGEIAHRALAPASSRRLVVTDAHDDSRNRVERARLPRAAQQLSIRRIRCGLPRAT